MIIASAVLSAVAACGSTVQVSGSGATDSVPLGGAGGSSTGIDSPADSATDGALGNDAAGDRGSNTGPAGSGAGPSSTVVSGKSPDGTGAHGTTQVRTGPQRPVRIGVLVPQVGDANGAIGAQSTQPSVSAKSLATALALSLNTKGGMDGHKVELVYRSWDATSSNYSNDAAAACAYFTQDDPVHVVIDLGLGLHYGMQECLAKRGVADIGPPSDDVATSAAKLFATPNSVTSSRRYRGVVQGLAATGYLNKTSRIGVVLENCADLARAYERSVLPALAQHGLKQVTSSTVDCTQGFTSAGPAASALQGAVLKFNSAGVDRVLFVSDFEQVALMLFANQAESQGYRPGYALSGLAAAAITRANIPSGQWPQLHGVGHFPYADTDDPGTAPLPAERHCLQLLKDGGMTVRTWTDRALAAQMCNNVLLISAAVHARQGDVSGASIAAGIETLGSRFAVAGLVSTATSFSSTRRDGPSQLAVFQYVAACSCSRYSGRPFAVR